jgi:hypothetical protein
MSELLELNPSSVIDVPKGYRAYKIKGVEQLIIAKKGGPSAEAIKNDESYQELRNNQKEFGVASALSKTLRDSLPKELAEISEKYTSGKLTAQFRNLVKFDDSETGKRSFVLSENGAKIEGFNFNAERPYPEEFSKSYFVKGGSHRGHAILHFPEFIPAKVLNAPENATNFKINAHLVTLSDYFYDEAIQGYTAANPEYHGKFGTFESQMLPLLKMPIAPFTEQVTSHNWKPVPLKTGVFLIMAIRFFQYGNSQFKQLSKDSFMHIQKVF